VSLLDDPKFVRMVFGVRREPGAYALLLGSGVSRGAGVPSGWDVTVDLVNEIAQMQSPGITDPLGWYREKFGEEPRYDTVLKRLGKGSADRQALVTRYFEPTLNERNQGVKVPCPAHKSIARLVAQGYIHVILTTNFDRLLEESLAEVGITPNVVYGAEGIRGARSYASEQCTIIKVNGDYKDTRIRNSVEELSEFPTEFHSYLGAVFDAFGLVVCGWSATYDIALTRIVRQHPNLLYGTYWLAKGELEPVATELAKARKADIIAIDSANSAFQGLEDAVLARGLIGGERFSADQLANIVRECAGDPTRETRLAELLLAESIHVVSSVSSFPSEGLLKTKDDLAPIVGQAVSMVETLSTACANLSYFAPITQARWTASSIARVCEASLAAQNGDTYDGLVRLPATLLAFSSLMGALLAGRADTAAFLLLHPVLLSRQAHFHWPSRFNELSTLGRLTQLRVLPAMPRGQIVAGDTIRSALTSMSWVQLATSADQFDAMYEVAEYGVGITAQAHFEEHLWNVPGGWVLRRWYWQSGGSQKEADSVVQEFRRCGLRDALAALMTAEGAQVSIDETERLYQEKMTGYGSG